MPSLGLLGLTAWMIVERPKAFIPTEDQGYVICVVQTPDGTSREKTAAVVQRVDAAGQELEGVEHTVAIDGLNVINSTNQTNCGVVFCPLEEWSKRTKPELRANALAKKLQGILVKEIRDAMALVLQPPPIRGLSQTGGSELMIEDQLGQGARGHAARRRPVPRRRPQAARADRRLHRPSRPASRSSSSTSTGPRPAGSTCRSPTSSPPSRSTSAATTSTTSTSTARSGRSWSRPKGAPGPSPRTSAASTS